MASGFPDYYSASAPARTGLRAGQSRWSIILSTIIPPGDSGLVPLYTVPAGKQLIMTFFKGSKRQPGIALGYVYRDTAATCGLYIDVPMVYNTGESGGYVFNEGEVLGFSINNLLSININVEVMLQGTLTEV